METIGIRSQLFFTSIAHGNAPDAIAILTNIFW
jgi:hypothetical protein